MYPLLGARPHKRYTHMDKTGTLENIQFPFLKPVPVLVELMGATVSIFPSTTGFYIVWHHGYLDKKRCIDQNI